MVLLVCCTWRTPGLASLDLHRAPLSVVSGGGRMPWKWVAAEGVLCRTRVQGCLREMCLGAEGRPGVHRGWFPGWLAVVTVTVALSVPPVHECSETE